MNANDIFNFYLLIIVWNSYLVMLKLQWLRFKFWWTFNNFLVNLKDISFCTISNEKKKKRNNHFLKVVFSDTKIIFWMQHYMSWSHRIL